MNPDVGTLELSLGHRFENRQLLEQALTHKSRIYEKNSNGGTSSDNEQL